MAQTITSTPTKDQLINLMIGDLVPNCFGKLRPVTQIHHRGTDINGKYFVCFYTQYSDNSSMSGSLKEDSEIFTLYPVTA